MISPDVFSHSALDLCWNRGCLYLLQLMLASFMERMPNLLDFTASFTDLPFWSSLTFMHSNPSKLALLFGSNYTQRINSSLNPVTNPFPLQPLPSALLLARRNEHTLLRQSSVPLVNIPCLRMAMQATI